MLDEVKCLFVLVGVNASEQLDAWVIEKEFSQTLFCFDFLRSEVL